MPVLTDGQEAWTLCCREIRGHYPSGVYTVQYHGTGELKFDYDVREIVSSEKGLVKLRVEAGDGGIHVVLLKTDPADPVRNIRIWMPGYGPGEEHDGEMFYPTFLERLKPFGLIRYMDWGRTNNSDIKTWADRPLMTDASWNRGGVPIEMMVELANRTNTDPWFCVPHLADDDYIKRMAELIKASLKPGLTPYFELSNEVWNWQFQQAQYAKKQGEAANIGSPDWLRWYSRRSVQMLDICKNVFGDRPIVRILASQAGWSWTAEQILSFEGAASHADALAIAPYFNTNPNMSPNEKGNAFVEPITKPVIDALLASGVVPFNAESEALLRKGKVSAALKLHGLEWDKARPAMQKLREIADKHTQAVLENVSKEIDTGNYKWMTEHKSIADKYKLKLFTYEAGQHLVGVGEHANNEVLEALLTATNRRPEMYDLYKRYLANWDRAGGDLLCAFSYAGQFSKWGSWGSLEWMDQPLEAAPKYRALAEWAQSPKPVR